MELIIISKDRLSLKFYTKEKSKMIIVYEIISGILFLFLAIVWKKNDIANTFMKIVFIIMTLWTIFILFKT